MNNSIIIAILVVAAIAAGALFLFAYPFKTTVHTGVLKVQPGNISYSFSACPAMVNGEVYSAINTLSSAGFSVYNVSGYKDYVISPGSSGSITVNVTRELVGGNATQYTNTSPMNITDRNGFSFYSANGQTISEAGYDTLIPYANITNVTGRYCVGGSASACSTTGPIITGFTGLAALSASCGQDKFNISLGSYLGTSVNISNASAYIYLTEENGSLIRSNLTLLALQNRRLFAGESEQFSFAGNACGSSVKNYSFYASINYSLSGSNTTHISSGEVKGSGPQSVPKNGFESKLNIPPLAPFLGKMPITVNFSGNISSNISGFLEYESGHLNISTYSASNNSGIINATFSIGVPIYILHPGIITAVNPMWRMLSVHQSGTFDTVFNVASNATQGTYWISPEVSGQFPCSYQYYALLTIGDAPYNGSVSIVRFA